MAIRRPGISAEIPGVRAICRPHDPPGKSEEIFPLDRGRLVFPPSARARVTSISYVAGG